MPKKKIRKKSGKIKGWEIKMHCEFTKENEAQKFIEECSMVVHTRSQLEASDSSDVHNAIEEWIRGLIEEKGYKNKCNFKIDRWVAIRS